nr:MAG TPA: hypothetical protein [Bacteriophage sp.]
MAGAKAPAYLSLDYVVMVIDYISIYSIDKV